MKVLFRNLSFLFVLFVLAFKTEISNSQTLRKGTVQRINVPSKLLEGNLAGDPSIREVSVYLPANYATNPKKRYAVVYYLHGFTDDDAQWYGLKNHWINLPAILDTAFSKGGVNDLIFVTPNAFTNFSGSFYSNSVSTGNWEDFVSKELVSYIDKHYRTIAKPSARGLMGHSMGGYGTMRIGEKNPEVFSSIYLLSPATLLPPKNTLPKEKFESIKTFDDLRKSDFGTRICYSLAAAWSPNPNNPPFYADLPVAGSEQLQEIHTKWAANAPLASLDQYISNLKKLKAIAFDAGDRDEPIATGIRMLDRELTKYNIKHDFEVYQGDHLNRIGVRIRDKALPFFTKNLTDKAVK